MKRVFVLAFLPMVLIGLETVNLAKNHSFEKENEVWQEYTGTRQPAEEDFAEANAHDSESAFSGIFSASNDTRQEAVVTPSPLFFDSAVVIQGLSVQKPLKDLDSLTWLTRIIPSESGYEHTCMLALVLEVDFGEADWQWCIYSSHGPQVSEGSDGLHRKIFNFEIPDDTSWIEWKRSIDADWIAIKGLSPDAVLDSIAVVGYGRFDPNWLGQKVYWDDIRLMGYADYDVGVKEILSGDSLEAGSPYQPVARIKNFGRENADSFLVMAEIKDGASIIYVDTLPWSLDGDTEDTVTFADFDPPFTGPYTLTEQKTYSLRVRTHMTPDECDEDDEVSKEIGHSSVSESPLPEGLTLEVRSIASPLQVFYSLPYGEHGTLTLFDATGRRIERMAVTRSGSVTFNSALASGVYVVRLECGSASVAGKAVVLQ